MILILLGALRANISSILEIERRNSSNTTSVCLSTTKMPGNRALHWPHKLYQPRHIVMDTKTFFRIAKLNEWTHNKIFARFNKLAITLDAAN